MKLKHNERSSGGLKLRPIRSNMTELELDDMKILFSYETPVAYKVLGPNGMEYYKTSTHYSRTTTKHINQWLPKDQAEEVDQELLDNLVK